MLSCSTYKTLIDRGWRRSGKYCYKPDMRATCCPQYTISLEAAAFVPSKNQRQLLHRFAAFVIDGDHEGKPGWGPAPTTETAPEQRAQSNSTTSNTAATTTTTTTNNLALNSSTSSHPTMVMTKDDSLLTTAKSVTFTPPAAPPTISEEEQTSRRDGSSRRKGKSRSMSGGAGLPSVAEDAAAASTSPSSIDTRASKAAPKGGKRKAPTDLSEMVHELEGKNSTSEKPFKHKFEYIVEEASFTEEKYELFRRYQTQIHHEPDSKVTRKGFRRFLVDSPLEVEPTSNEAYNYGSHHGLYRLDDKLIALAVLDILPGAVSSVYFAWDPDYAGLGLGKVSALREIAMVREMKSDGVEDMDAYMMGYYIHTCVKMRYKGEYQPSSLLDPETNVYYPFEFCKPILDRQTHAFFSRPPPLASGSTQTLPIAIPPNVSSTVTTPRLNNVAMALPNPPMPTPKEEPHTQTSMDEDADDDDDDDDDDDIAYPNPAPPGCLEPKSLPKKLLLDTVVLEGSTLVPLLFSAAWHDSETQREVKELLASTGEAVGGKIAIWTG